MVKNFALAAIVGLFATATFAEGTDKATPVPAEKKEEKAAVEPAKIEAGAEKDAKHEEKK
jgi:hypothetical protein